MVMQLTKKDVSELLKGQTKEMKGLLDTHLEGVKDSMGQQTVVILSAVDEKIQKLDLKFTEKFDKVITALDKYLEKTTNLETEFTMMKNDLKRVKKVLKEKLGVDF